MSFCRPIFCQTALISTHVLLSGQKREAFDGRPKDAVAQQSIVYSAFSADNFHKCMTSLGLISARCRPHSNDRLDRRIGFLTAAEHETTDGGTDAVLCGIQTSSRDRPILTRDSPRDRSVSITSLLLISAAGWIHTERRAPGNSTTGTRS